MQNPVSTAGESFASPSSHDDHNTQQGKLIKVTFPLYPHQFSMLKRYLSGKGLPLYIRNEVSCSLRVSRDSVSLYLDPSELGAVHRQESDVEGDRSCPQGGVL